MIVTLHIQELQTLAQVRAFVPGNEPISFTLTDRHAAYDWMSGALKQFGYARCKCFDKGILRRYLRKVTGFSRAQAARRIKRFTTGGGRIKDRRHSPSVPFVRRYTVEDIRLLAEMDALHGTLSGTTTSVSGRSGCMGMPATSGWRVFPTATCTTCACIKLTYPNADHSTRPARPRSTSANGANQRLTGAPVICAWTACIRAISTESRACSKASRRLCFRWAISLLQCRPLVGFLGIYT